MSGLQLYFTTEFEGFLGSVKFVSHNIMVELITTKIVPLDKKYNVKL